MNQLVTRHFSICQFCSAYNYSWDPGFLFIGESHNFWEIVYVVNGSVEVTENEKTYILKQGDMIIHAPLEFHKIRSCNGTCPHVFITSFYCEGFLPSQLTEGIFFLSEDEQKTYYHLFHRISHLFINQSTSQYASQECADSLSCFLIGINEKHRSHEVCSTTKDAKLFEQVVDFMKHNLYNSLMLESIAKSCHISVSYMKILFKKYAGFSPKTYYSRLRCMEAIKLLKGGLSVSETANVMNFSSPSYFSVFFKRIIGQSPSQFAEIHSPNNHS